MIQLDDSPDPVIPVCIQGSDSYTEFCTSGNSLIHFNGSESFTLIRKEEMQEYAVELNEMVPVDTEFYDEDNRTLGKDNSCV